MPDYGLDSGMSLVKKGILRSGYEPEPLVLTSDAFEVDFWEKASVVRYYRNGGWHQYVTSD